MKSNAELKYTWIMNQYIALVDATAELSAQLQILTAENAELKRQVAENNPAPSEGELN